MELVLTGCGDILSYCFYPVLSVVVNACIAYWWDMLASRMKKLEILTKSMWNQGIFSLKKSGRGKVMYAII